MRIKSIALMYVFLFYCCDDTIKIEQPTCEVLKIVYNDFIQKHKNELKYMKIEQTYICNFDDFAIDPAIKMDSVFTFVNSPITHFDIIELKNIGQKCLEIPNVIHISNNVAMDTIRFSKNPKKAIWGITNFRKTNNYYYLIISFSISSRTIIGDEYLLEMRNGKPLILKVNPISS